MIDLNKTYKLRNETSLKLISQPRRSKAAEANPGKTTYSLVAECEDKETGEVSTEVWTAEGEYYASPNEPHYWDLVEAETQPTTLDPAKKYRLRDFSVYEVLNPITIGPDPTAKYPITAQLRHKETGIVTWETWTVDGSFIKHGRGWQADRDLVEDVPPMPEWHDWSIDAKVLCRDGDTAYYTKGYYAGERNGRPTAWANGGTSWSAETRTPWDWDEIKLAEPE